MEDVAGDPQKLPEALRETLIRACLGSDPSDEPIVRAALAHPGERARVLAVRAAAARGWLDEAGWLQALADHSAEVRREAAVRLARSHPSTGVREALERALGDADALVAAEAAHSLGEIGDPDSCAALEAAAASAEDPRVREFAVAALGLLGDPRSAPVVIAALEDRLAVRRRAVVALAGFEGEQVREALEHATEDRDWQVRSAAERLLEDDEDDEA